MFLWLMRPCVGHSSCGSIPRMHINQATDCELLQEQSPHLNEPKTQFNRQGDWIQYMEAYFKKIILFLI